MRFIKILFAVVFLITAASAAELTIKVEDPGGTALAGARVILLQGDSVVALENTSPEGLAVFQTGNGSYRVRVLAPGFAAQTADAPATSSLTVTLQLAPVTESVVVTATRSPVPTESAGADVSSLTGRQIETLNPVAASEALRYLPGAVVNTTGQRGGIASLFVRGGDSRYNKVIVDGVTVNEPGGTIDLGVIPLNESDRLELVRGAQSTLYGSDAMTSVLQTWTREGSTEVPELRFGADGGNLDTAHGYLSLAGVRGRFDYNFFGDHFYTAGQGINDEYSNSLQGGNIGIALSNRVALRLRARHSNSYTGVQGEWNFNGQALEPPDDNQYQRQNNLLASLDLTVRGPGSWQHRFSGFEYRHIRGNVNGDNPERVFDSAFDSIAKLNRAGFEYEGQWVQRSWAQATVGYEFEDENGVFGDLLFPPLTNGLRLNHAVYGQELLTLGRLSLIGGARFVHNETFGNKGVPRVAVTFQALRGGETFSGTAFRFAYATGIKEPRFDEAFARGPFILPSPALKAEENRAFEAGFQQGLLGGRFALTATYYNNLFRNQIDFQTISFAPFLGQYLNINKSIAHGAEVELKGHLLHRLTLDAGYNYASTQILEAPAAFDLLHAPGSPLIRRPKHSGSLLLTYTGNRWGGNLGTTVVGRRADSDFLIFNIDHAAGYARVDLGAWYAFTSRLTAYVNVENVLDKQYEEVVGYPSLGANFRAGMRFRIGGK